jgi:hypothetical protein
MQFATRFDILKRLTAGEKKQNKTRTHHLPVITSSLKIYIFVFFLPSKKWR